MDCTRKSLIGSSVVIAAICEFSFATTGFGPAILYQISWQLLAVAGVSGGSLSEAIGNIVFFEGVTSLFQLWNLRKHILWRFGAVYITPYVLMLPVGTLALERLGGSLWTKRALGLVLLLVALIQLTKRLRGNGGAIYPPGRPSLDAEPRSWSTFGALAITGAIAGGLRGLYGVSGPPVMILLMHFPVDQANYRCVATLQRLITTVEQGLLLYFNESIRLTCWQMYIALTLGGFLGIIVGNRAAKYVDKESFQLYILLFLASGALLMLCSGTRVPSLIAAALVALAMLLALTCRLITVFRQPSARGLACGDMDATLTEAGQGCRVAPATQEEDNDCHDRSRGGLAQ